MSDTNDPNNLEINPKNTVESGDQHGATIVLVNAHSCKVGGAPQS